jgi:hypothetical protein
VIAMKSSQLRGYQPPIAVRDWRITLSRRSS